MKTEENPTSQELVGAKAGEIALVENTSVGLNIAANVLSYPPGSKIVTTDLEYPSVVYPWLRKTLGVKVQYVKNVDGRILLDDMEKAVDDKTVAVAISHVEYANGFRNDLRVLSEIVHEHGAYLIVDAIQSVGTMHLDVKRDDVDFLMAACYKWLLSPHGAAYLYVKDELIEKFEPPFVGWASVKQETFDTADFYDIWNLNLSKTASRFEVGTSCTISLVGAREAMKMLLSYGIENVRKRITKLTDRLIEAAEDLGLKLQTPKEKTVPLWNSQLQNRQDLRSFVEKLGKKGIVVSARANGIRVSPHFYNTEEEIDALMKESQTMVKVQWLRLKKSMKKTRPLIISSLKSDIIRHVFAVYDIQNDPQHTATYAAFENGKLEGYILIYTAADVPSVILECEDKVAERLLEHAPPSKFIVHAPPNLLPAIKKRFPDAEHYVEDWMLVRKNEARFFESELVRRLRTEEDALKLANLLLSRKDRPAEYAEEIRRMDKQDAHLRRLRRRPTGFLRGFIHSTATSMAHRRSLHRSRAQKQRVRNASHIRHHRRGVENGGGSRFVRKIRQSPSHKGL